MGRAIVVGLVLVSGLLAAGEPDPAKLNELLLERRAVNAQYAADSIAWAREEGGEFAAPLVAHEQGSGRAWDDLIRYATDRDELELKQIVLRLEYHAELSSAYGSLVYAETDEERAGLRQTIEDYAAKLKAVDPAFVASSPEQAVPRGRRGGAAPY